MNTLAQQMADFGVGLKFENLPAAVVHEVKRRVIDSLGCALGAWHAQPCVIARRVAAARLLRLDADRTRQALGIAGVASAALRQSRVGELSHWKGCAFANAARHGVFSALLARAGMTGPAPIFEGEMGFAKLVSGPLDARDVDARMSPMKK